MPNQPMSEYVHRLSPSRCPAGEYVAVEFIESVLGKCEYVEQVWVYGSSYESVLVAVVVPKKHALLSWAQEQVSGKTLRGMTPAYKCSNQHDSKVCGQGPVLRCQHTISACH